MVEMPMRFGLQHLGTSCKAVGHSIAQGKGILRWSNRGSVVLCHEEAGVPYQGHLRAGGADSNCVKGVKVEQLAAPESDTSHRSVWRPEVL